MARTTVNSTFTVGRLALQTGAGTSPILHETPAGNPVIMFEIAVDRNNTTEFLPCHAYGPVAEYGSRAVVGDTLAIEGCNRTRFVTYGSTATFPGVRVKIMEIQALSIVNLGRRESNVQAAGIPDDSEMPNDAPKAPAVEVAAAPVEASTPPIGAPVGAAAETGTSAPRAPRRPAGTANTNGA